MKIKAYAKINLLLDITGKRCNGYHDIATVMQTIDLYDTVYVDIVSKSGIEITCTADNIPTDQTNIAYKAAYIMLNESKLQCGVKIHIDKKIPSAAGLAGGSSDGAAVICALNRLLGLNYKNEKLFMLSAAAGADIPYCIIGSTALCEGIGEIITPLNSFDGRTVLIVKPPIDVSTKWVYNTYDETDESKIIHPDLQMFIQTYQGNFKDAAKYTGNVLEYVTISKYPVISQIKDKMYGFGAEFSMMSGSGPTVFGIYQNDTDAKCAFDFFKKSYNETYLTKTVKKENSY